MKLTYEKVAEVREKFVENYFLKEPYLQYMSSCVISVDGNLNIVVGLKQSLPPSIKLPEKYKGVKIVTEIVGEMIAL